MAREENENKYFRDDCYKVLQDKKLIFYAKNSYRRVRDRALKNHEAKDTKKPFRHLSKEEYVEYVKCGKYQALWKEYLKSGKRKGLAPTLTKKDFTKFLVAGNIIITTNENQSVLFQKFIQGLY